MKLTPPNKKLFCEVEHSVALKRIRDDAIFETNAVRTVFPLNMALAAKTSF